MTGKRRSRAELRPRHPDSLGKNRSKVAIKLKPQVATKVLLIVDLRSQINEKLLQLRSMTFLTSNEKMNGVQDKASKRGGRAETSELDSFIAQFLKPFHLSGSATSPKPAPSRPEVAGEA